MFGDFVFWGSGFVVFGVDFLRALCFISCKSMSKLRVNKDKCIGCGVCVSLYPHLFKIEGGKSTLIDPKKEIEEKKAEEIVASCPMGAIEIEK